jgi:hypothetical protein
LTNKTKSPLHLCGLSRLRATFSVFEVFSITKVYLLKKCPALFGAGHVRISR